MTVSLTPCCGTDHEADHCPLDQAAHVFPWEDRDGSPVRPFIARSWRVGEIFVRLGGDLHPGGTVTWRLDVGDVELNADQVFELGAIAAEAHREMTA